MLELSFFRARFSRGGMKSEFLALKHESRILGQTSNPVCGISKMEQVRLCAVWLMENWLGSSLNQMQGWTTVRVRESYSPALERGPMDEIWERSVLVIATELSMCLGACKEEEHTPQGERIMANCDNNNSCKSGAQRNFIFIPNDENGLFSKNNYSLLEPFISDMHPTPVFILIK